MELLNSFRRRFGEVSRDSKGPCLKVSDQGATLEGGYFIFGTADRVCRIHASLKTGTGEWFEAFHWPAPGADPLLDWTPYEERFSDGGLVATREGRSAHSALSFEDWIRSRLEKILALEAQFTRAPWAFEEAEAESVLERIRPALEAFLSSELLRAVKPMLARLKIPEEDFLRIKREHPEAQRHEFLSFLDALQAEKRLQARATTPGGTWGRVFGEFLDELEAGARDAGPRRPEEFEAWWQNSGVNAAMIAAAPEIPDAAIKRALRDYPI